MPQFTILIKLGMLSDLNMILSGYYIELALVVGKYRSSSLPLS